MRTGKASHAIALRQDSVATTKSMRAPSNRANLQLGEAAAEKASSTAAALSDALANKGNTALAANVCTVARSLESQLCGNDGGTAALASEKDCSGSQGVSEEDAEEQCDERFKKYAKGKKVNKQLIKDPLEIPSWVD